MVEGGGVPYPVDVGVGTSEVPVGSPVEVGTNPGERS